MNLSSIILARESIFRSGFCCFFFSFLLLLFLLLCCNFRRVSLFSFYVFFSVDLLLLSFWFWAEDINLSGFRLVFICCFILCWLLFLC